MVQLITPQLLDALTVRAKSSPRLRTNHNFHKTYEENPNRFLNVMARGTYFTPHRHSDPPKSETFLVLRGRIIFLTFQEDGEIATANRLGEDADYGIDIAPGVWHTILVETETAVCFEIKPGPYVPANDKDFAPWAPREGEKDCMRYADSLWDKARLHLSR
ncbi:MAG: WbuC family cupin fold metalloprotein [Turneriella sp.]|nr:WbuC family cupin fold metalloprotein [Turneriella sp.]